MTLSGDFLANAWKIYYYLAWFATIFFVFKLIVFMFIGGDTEVSSDFNTEFETETSFDYLSLQSLLAFLMGFGWMGYAGLVQFGLNHFVSFVCAFGVGLIFMFSSAYLMFSVRKLEKNDKKDKNTALNKQGTAYSNFEPKGQGQIEIEINGQLTVTDAINVEDESIPSFAAVEVVKVENDILYIRKKG